MQAIRDLPGENYLLDLELALLDVTFHYKISNIWTAYVIASGVSYQGGFLDSTIEGFHDTFRLQHLRPAGGHSQPGQPDLRLEVDAILEPGDADRWRLARSDPRRALHRLDACLAIGIWRRKSRSRCRYKAGASCCRPATPIMACKFRYSARDSITRSISMRPPFTTTARPQISPQDAQVVPTVIFGYERMLTSRTNVNLQGYISKSVYSRDETDLDELLGEKYQLSLGLRHRIGAMSWSRSASPRTCRTSTTRRISVFSSASPGCRSNSNSDRHGWRKCWQCRSNCQPA